MFCYSLIDRAVANGLKLRTFSEVRNIEKKGDEFHIDTTSGTYIAKKVINAAGVWAPFIGEMVDIDIPITPRKGHILVGARQKPIMMRSEEHTSELQSRGHLVCRLLLEKKKHTERDKKEVRQD